MDILGLVEEFNEYSPDRTVDAQAASEMFGTELLSLATECGIIVFIPENNEYMMA